MNHNYERDVALFKDFVANTMFTKPNVIYPDNNRFERYTEEEKGWIAYLVKMGASVQTIGRVMGRSKRAITAYLERESILAAIEEYNQTNPAN